MRIGFAGLGRMGAPMAANLADAGHRLLIWNRSQDKCAALARDHSVEVVDHPADLTRRCEVVVTMLADDAASETVHWGPNGLFAELANPGPEGAHTFIEMGTVSPHHLAQLRDKAQGRTVIDAPVSGSTQAAENAGLLIMAGATQSQVDTLSPVFGPMGRRTMALDRPGAGAVMKLSVNMLIHGINQCLAESMALADSAGIAPEVAFDVLENSAAAAPMLSYRRHLYLNESAHPVSFTVALAHKDMALALQLAQQQGLRMPQSQVTYQELSGAASAGYGERDMASMLSYLSQEREIL